MITQICKYCNKSLLSNRKDAKTCGSKPCQKQWRLEYSKQPHRRCANRDAQRRYNATEKGKLNSLKTQRNHRMTRKTSGKCYRCGSVDLASDCFCKDCLITRRLKKYMIDSGEFDDLLDRQSHRGFWSGDKITRESATIDHIISQKECIERGYPMEVYNNKCNIVLDHKPMNSSKQEKRPSAWLADLGENPFCVEAGGVLESLVISQMDKLHNDLNRKGA